VKPALVRQAASTLKSGFRALLLAWLLGAGMAGGASLYPFSIDLDHLTGILDFSDLRDRPIQDQDRLVVCGSRLCKAGGAGREPARSPVRLFGVNLAHDAVFPSVEQADMLIPRLRRLGINLVRLHGFDGAPYSEPQMAQSVLLDGPFPTFNPESLERLKRFLEKLRGAGIYVDLNLHVDFRFRPAIDKVPFAFPGDDFMPEQSKPLHIFDDKMIALQVGYAERLLKALGGSARNVVAIVEISNESSLVYEWERDRLHQSVKGYYRSELLAKWLRYQQESADGSSAIDFLPARTDPVAEAVKDRFVRFLTELDRRYLERMRTAIKSVNPDLLVVGTQMAYGGFQNLTSNALMDVMDSHFYVDQYGFLGAFADWKTWYIRDVSGFDDGLKELRNVAFHRPLGKPYIVSEYNQPWPNRQAAEIIPVMAGMASLQDWSAIVFYSYSETRADWEAGTPREFALDTDFTKLPTVGPMAWLYRTFEVGPARTMLTVPLPDQARLAATRAGQLDRSAEFMAQAFGIETQSAFSQRIDISLGSALAYRQPDGHGLPETAKDPGASFRIEQKHMLFNTRSVIGVIGRVTPGVDQSFGAFRLKLVPGARDFVTFIAMSRDRAPVAESRRMLWVIPGYTLGSTPGVTPAEPEHLTAAEVGFPQRIKDAVGTQTPPHRVRLPSYPRPSGYGVLAAQAPVWMERVECTVTLPHALTAVKVYPLDGRGRRMSPLPARDAYLRDGVLSVHLQGDGQVLSPWYELTFD